MKNNFEDRFHHGSTGSGNRHEDARRNDLRDGDFGREYENRYRNQDGRNRKSYDEYRSSQSRMPDMNEGRARRGYDVEDTRHSGYGYDSDRNGSFRTPGQREQGGYGTGHMGGYSGSSFGGTNYSSHGSFSGDSGYGSMSGGGGNMGLNASSSGYGNSTGSGRPYGNSNAGYGGSNKRTSWNTDPYGNSYGSHGGSRNAGRGTFSDGNTYKGYGSGNVKGPDATGRQPDRGGYTDYDPNNRWNS